MSPRQALNLSQRRIQHIWKLVSAIGPHDHPKRGGPFADSPALTALFERFRGRLRVEPAEAARLLRALTLSLTHPMMTDHPRTPPEIVDLFLHGAATRRSRSTRPIAHEERP